MMAAWRRNDRTRHGLAAGMLRSLFFFFGFVLLVFTGCAGPGESKPDDQPGGLPGTTVISPDPEEPVDNRPPEFSRSKRREVRDPEINFEFLLGWEVQHDVEAGRVTIERTNEKQLWGLHTAKVEYEFEAVDGEFTIRPPAPIAIRDRFDCLNIWVHGPSGTGNSDNPGCDVEVLVRDAGNQDHVLSLGVAPGGGWGLLHRRLSDEVSARISYPCSFTGIRFSGCPGSVAVTNYLDSLSFYYETFPPIEIEKHPSRNIELEPGQPAGVHTGRKRLDFPVGPETIVPDAGHPDTFNNQLDEVSDGIYEFSYRGQDGHLTYRVDTGDLGAGIRVRWDGQELGRFLVGARLLGIENPTRMISVLRREENALYIEYQGFGTRRLEIIGRSLVGQINAAGGIASGIDLGGYEGDRAWNHLALPGLPSASGGLMTIGWLGQGDGTNEPPCFVAASFDWYRSGASYFDPPGERSGEPRFGRAVYEAGTDGRTADVFERVVLSVSPRLNDVLPTISNPVGEHAQELSRRIWVDPQPAGAVTNELDVMSRLLKLGVTNGIQTHYLASGVGQTESRSLRTHASPRIGGDKAFARVLKRQRKAGWIGALADNVMQVHPINGEWDEEKLLRGPAWQWREGTASQFLLKPPLAVELNNNLIRRNRRKFHPGGSYVDELCAVPPWEYTDYDSRIPGAGLFGQAYYCVGEILRHNAAAFGGPVAGRGGWEALYGGLLDGYLPGDSAEPYLPVFCLNRLQPLCCRIGAGDMIVSGTLSDEALDRYLAAQFGYGGIGRIRPAVMTDRQIFRSATFAKFMQGIFTLRQPGRIAYWDGQNYVSTSEAITEGCLNRSQLYMIFDDSHELWVNGSEALNWDVKVGSDLWTLPPYGWVAVGPDSLCMSSVVADRRLDYIESSRYTWIDGREEGRKFRGITCAGALLMNRTDLDHGEQIDLMHLGRAESIEIPVVRGLTEDSVVGSRTDGEEDEGDFNFRLGERSLSIDVPGGITHFRITIHKP